jgi:hypothetical protein
MAAGQALAPVRYGAPCSLSLEGAGPRRSPRLVPQIQGLRPSRAVRRASAFRGKGEHDDLRMLPPLCRGLTGTRLAERMDPQHRFHQYAIQSVLRPSKVNGLGLNYPALLLQKGRPAASRKRSPLPPGRVARDRRITDGCRGNTRGPSIKWNFLVGHSPSASPVADLPSATAHPDQEPIMPAAL